MSVLLLAGLAVAGGSHNGDTGSAGHVTDFRVHTYDDPPAEQRRPGATDRSYWTEAVTDGIPADDPVYLTKTVTYRPVPADCTVSDTEQFGIDRNGTNEGQRRIDDSATENVKSYGKDTDARDRYEAEYGEDGDLATTGWEYVERLEVEWYDRDDFGSPLKIYPGDRFVSAQRDCLDNPDVAGWYRFASITEAELENGTTIEQEAPTFSHWFYVCTCGSREAAVDTLGPPPSDRTNATPTPATEVTPNATATAGTDEGTPHPAVDGPTPAATPTLTRAPTDPPSRTTTAAASAPATPTPDWGDRVLETPTSAGGSGFTVPTALAALLWVAIAVRRG